MKGRIRYTLVAVGLFILWIGILNPEKVLLASWILIASILDDRPANPPPVAEGQITDKDWLDQAGAGRKLTAILGRRFPAGTKEDVLKSELLRQGFKFLSPPPAKCPPPEPAGATGRPSAQCFDATKMVKYVWGRSIVCSEHVVVQWSTDDSALITDVNGSYGSACL